MRRYIAFLAAAACAGVLTLLSPGTAEAGQFGALAQIVAPSHPQAATLLPVGYYGGGDYYGDDQKDDSDGGGYNKDGDGGEGYHKDGYGGGYGGGGYHKKDGYGSGHGGGGYHKDGYGSGYRKHGYGGYAGYRYHRKHHDDYPNGCCDNGCYKKKWVCEESEPRCRKARECVWHYGKEYCRYVRRCYGGGDRYCKWISYRSHNCGW